PHLCRSVHHSSWMEFCALPAEIMLSGCDLRPVLDYKGSSVDCWINYTTLMLTTVSVIVCTRKASQCASKYRRAAPWFWVPFSLALVVLQLLADCTTGNVGISAVWSANVGFISLGWSRLHALWLAGGKPSTMATAASILAWVGACLYYAAVEEAITTVAHLVAFTVGAAALRFFEAIHMIPHQDT
ncbi:unnamed protein product, partial [Discosporangium mesarthrocarpum]